MVWQGAIFLRILVAALTRGFRKISKAFVFEWPLDVLPEIRFGGLYQVV